MEEMEKKAQGSVLFIIYLFIDKNLSLFSGEGIDVKKKVSCI